MSWHDWPRAILQSGRAPLGGRRVHRGKLTRGRIGRSLSAGFTILEVLIVLVIIGMIMGLVGPQLFKQLDKSKVQTAETQVKLLRASLSAFYLDMQRYPTTTEGLNVLLTQPTGADSGQWAGPYIQDAVPLDPWGKPYNYRQGESRDKPFYIFSFGADGKVGGTGVDRDIGLLPPTSTSEAR